MKARILISCSLFLFFQIDAQINQDSLLSVIANSTDENLQATHYINLIRANKYDNIDNVIHYCGELYKLKKTSDPAYTYAQADYYSGYYNLTVGQLDSALHFFEQVSAYGSKSGDHSFLSSAKTNIAIIYQEQGRYDEAIAIYFELIELEVKNKTIKRVLPLYNNIGLVYETLKDNNKALEFYQKTYKIATNINDFYQINLSSGNIANIFTTQGKLDSALHYAEICQSVAIKNEFSTSIAFADLLLGNIHQKKGNSKIALNYLLNATHAFDTMRRNALFINAAIALAAVYHEQKDHEACEFLAHRILIKSNESQNIYGLQMAHKFLSQAYEKSENIKKSLYHFQQYKIYHDSIYNQEKTQLVYNLEKKYETAKKDAKISKQKLEIEKQIATRNYLIASLIGVGLLILLIINRFKNHRKLAKQDLKLKQQKIEVLEQENRIAAMDFVVQGQEKERMRIAKDLHDGLGGILTTARLQLNNLSNDTNSNINNNAVLGVKQLVADAYTEVRKIAHNMMPNALVNLGLSAAVEDLCDKINISGHLRIIPQLYLDETLISSPTKISLFRIIQEAINNTLKHAEAKEAIVQLISNGNQIHLTIEDDGIGFDPTISQDNDGIGLKNISSRVESLKGTITFDTAVGRGLCIDILIPL